MAAAADSLLNLSVPINGGRSGLLMPKLKYRFRVTLSGFGTSTDTTQLTKQVISFNRPSVSFDEIPIDIYNSKIYLAGKHTWETTTLEVRDDISGEVSALVGQQLQKQLDFYEQVASAAGIDYKFTTICEILDGSNGTADNQILETWTLTGCYLTTANYNELNYGSSEAVQISLTIRFDNALLEKGATGLNYTLGGAIATRAVGTSVTGAGNL